MKDQMKNWNNAPTQVDCCGDGACQSSRPTQYDADDVTTWSHAEFEAKVASKLRAYWGKLEAAKYLLRDGKVVIAHEQIQGLSDGLGFIVNLFDKRQEAQSKDGNASN